MPDKAGHAVLRHLTESNQDSTLGASPQAYRQEQNILKKKTLLTGILTGAFIVLILVYSATSCGKTSNHTQNNHSVTLTMAWCTIHGGSNLLSAFQAAAPKGTEIGVTTIPTSNPKKSNFIHPSMFFSVSASTKNPDEAVAVLNYLINSLEANNILLGERGVPASAHIADMIAEKLDEPEQKAADFVRNVIVPNSSAIDPPDPEGSIALAKALTDILEKVAYGDYTAQEAAEEYYRQEQDLWGE